MGEENEPTMPPPTVWVIGRAVRRSLSIDWEYGRRLGLAEERTNMSMSVSANVKEKVSGGGVDGVAAVVESKRLFRRRPLLVEAEARSDGSWSVLEAGRVVEVGREEFALLYELVESEGGDAATVDAGLPDMEPGALIEKDGRRLLRVEVVAGKGGAAYWVGNKPCGQDAAFKAIADGISDENASHYAGRFVVPWEGSGPLGLKRTWVVVKPSVVGR